MKKILIIIGMVVTSFNALTLEPPKGLPKVNGIIKKLDQTNQQITLKHERIPNLDMPGMTMPFLVENIQLFSGLQIGDQVVFIADINSEGEMVVVWIEKIIPNYINNLPQVKGVVKKIDHANQQITLKHERIPNLDMPGMTMVFLVPNQKFLIGINVGDLVYFSTELNSNDEMEIKWMSKSRPNPISEMSSVYCTSIANTYPKTSIEIDIRKGKYSTIRYEFIEGGFKGTAYTNSIGLMYHKVNGNEHLYYSGDNNLDTKLSFEKRSYEIQNAKLYHLNSGHNFDSVSCKYFN